jgi:hypothetical protein
MVLCFGRMKGDTLTLYVRSGFDGKKYGACPFSQRIFMLLIIKASKGKKCEILATFNIDNI